MSNPWTEVYKDIREPFLQEKMAKKDYDGDGKIETGTQEYMGSRDKAIKKAMGKNPKQEMKKESMHSSNPAQQAAIAMAKKKRQEDMMVAKKKKMEEEKKELPTTKMYRKAGNLSRDALSKGLDSKEGSKAQDRSSKIVSTISTAKEKERFSKMKTPAAQLRNEDVEDISELSKETMGSYVKKASKETRGNMMATQHGSGIPKKAKDIKLKQVNKRLKGMEMAGGKMAKEDVEPVIEEMEQFGLFMDMFVEQELEEELMDDILEIIYEKCWLSEKAQKCWKGYEKKGTQKLFGKTYNRCVKKEEVEEIDEAMTVTNADKKGNTPAYQNYMKGMKSKVTGKPMYKAADHMKNDK